MTGLSIGIVFSNLLYCYIALPALHYLHLHSRHFLHYSVLDFTSILLHIFTPPLHL